MKKLLVILAILTMATAAFAQLSYVGSAYTGANVGRTAQDSKLGYHDVMASPTGPNKPVDGTGATLTAERNGCQSCHVPHGAKEEFYLWKYTLPTNVTQDGTAITLDSASFHTLACIGCHDGVTATDVVANLPGGTFPSYAKMGPDLTHNHPVNAMLTQHGATAPPRQYVRFYTPAGYTLKVNGQSYPNGLGDTATYTGSTEFGYVECGSCHDPHKGDVNTYMFLRGPSGAVTPQYARLDLCRQCHGK